MEKRQFSVVIITMMLVALISGSGVSAQESKLRHIKNMENVGVAIDMATRDAIVATVATCTSVSSAGIIVIPPSDAGARKDVEFIRTRFLPASSVVIPSIIFPSGNTWKFNGFRINGDMNNGSIFHVFSIADFGNFWEQGAVVQVIIQLPGGTIETAQAPLRAFRSAPSPLNKVVLPIVRDVRWTFLNGNAFVIIDGSFTKDQMPEIFFGYTLLNPSAIVEVASDHILIDIKKDQQIVYYDGTYVVTVTTPDGNSSTGLFQR